MEFFCRHPQRSAKTGYIQAFHESICKVKTYGAVSVQIGAYSCWFDATLFSQVVLSQSGLGQNYAEPIDRIFAFLCHIVYN
ncbi:hypothetical protein LEP1GSC108_4124 [Leptospira weilii str. UI 13098]|uniref:Uncharacterized protein n=1 Tax=Leptospira weilii str. UI 13098 TaxID=1088542 RepID=M6PZY0_9LEPT|nr:hypothetical protein LEP1GSC108_4124 [Leptospira weilii str. UI 13098]